MLLLLCLHQVNFFKSTVRWLKSTLQSGAFTVLKKCPENFTKRTSVSSSALLSAIPRNRKSSAAKQPSKHRCWDAQTRATHWPGSLAASSVACCLVKVSLPPPYQHDWSGSVRFKSAPAASPALRKSPGMHSASSLRRPPTYYYYNDFFLLFHRSVESLCPQRNMSHNMARSRPKWRHGCIPECFIELTSPGTFFCYFFPPTTRLSWMWRVYLVTEVANLLFLLLHTSYRSVVNSKTGVNRDWEKDAGLARCLLGLSGNKTMKSAQ